MLKIVLSESQILDAVGECDGIIPMAAKKLKVSKSTLYDKISELKLKHSIELLRQRMDDVALETVHKNLSDVDVALKYLALRQRAATNVTNLQLNGGNLSVSVATVEQKEELEDFLSDSE